MKTCCSASLILAGVLAPACYGFFVPAGKAFCPRQQQHSTASMSMMSMSSIKPGTTPPLRSRIEHAVAVALATSVVVLGVASVPVALAEELPAGEPGLLFELLMITSLLGGQPRRIQHTGQTHQKGDSEVEK